MGPELPKGIKSCNLKIRDVAQPGRAQRSGRWGRRFKSCRPDFVFDKAHLDKICFFLIIAKNYLSNFNKRCHIMSK